MDSLLVVSWDAFTLLVNCPQVVLRLCVTLFGCFSIPIGSLFVILGTSLSAFTKYRRHGYVDWKLVLVIEPPTLVMAFVGGLLSNSIDAPVLRLLLAVTLVLASFFMFRQVAEKNVVAVQRWGYWQRTLGETSYVVRLPWLMPASTVAGLVAGMIGIAGGVLKVPAMVLLGNVPMRIAIGTSSLMVGFTALAGLSGHIIGGSFNILIALPLAAAAFAGGTNRFSTVSSGFSFVRSAIGTSREYSSIRRSTGSK